MADNVAITAGSGTTVAADEVVDGTLGTVKVQFVKLMDGTLDGTSKAAVGANGLACDVKAAVITSGTITTVSAVTAISNALPAGTNVIGHVIADTGSTTAVTGNVTAVQSTASNLKTQATGAGSAGTADTGVLTVQGIASMTKLLVTPDSVALPSNQSVNVSQLAGTTTDTNSGSKSAGTLRVVIATDQPALTNKLLVTPDSVALPANQSVNCAQIAGTNTVTGGVSGLIAIGGAAAEAATVSGNPVFVGGQGRSTLKTNVADGKLTSIVTDRYGRTQIVKPNVTITSSAASAITTNTNTSIVSAPSSGNHLKIYRVMAQNSAATATWLYWTEGSGGTKRVPMYLAQNQVISLNLEGSWELATATALFINTATTSINVEWMVEYETVVD